MEWAIYLYTAAYMGVAKLRGGFKTQSPVDRRFRLVLGGFHLLEQ